MDLYDGEIKYVDDKIKEIVDLLERKGLMKNSTLALFGDHGEGLGQHELWDHFGLHDSIVHVPLIIRDRGLSSGKRISDICTQADLLPTLMDLSGISDIPDFWGDTWPRSTDEFDGVSLTKVLKGNVKRNNIFLEGNRENARGMRTQNWKFINHAFEKTELFNVADDPMEKYDLSEENSEKADHMKNKLLEWMKKNGASRRQIVLMTKDRPRRSCPKSHYVH